MVSPKVFVFSTNLRKDVSDSGKNPLVSRATPVVVRKHISDSRENPQLTTTPRCTLSGPPEHKLKRIFVE